MNREKLMKVKVKKGQFFQIKASKLDLVGIVEKTNVKVKLPAWIIGNKTEYKALDDEKDGYVLVMKRKVIEVESGEKVLADIYIQSSHIFKCQGQS